MKLILVSLLLFGVNPFDVSEAEQSKSKTPAEQFRALQKKYNLIGGKFRKAKTDRDRKLAVEELGSLTSKSIKLAEENPKDPIALKVLRQAVQSLISVDSLAQHTTEMNKEHFPQGSEEAAASKIIQILTRDHIKSDQLGIICDRMRYGARQEFVIFLSSVIELSPHRKVQGMASLALAQLKHTHLRMMDLAADRKILSNRYDHIFGKNFLDSIGGRNRDAIAKRVEKLYQKALPYTDVTNIPFKNSVSEKAKAELYDLQHLSLGKKAPEIQGPDQDGKPFKLSDYRGKVVLLYFWMEY